MPFTPFRRDHLRSHRGSFAVRDHLQSNLGIISGLGIICGRGSFAALYSTHKRDHCDVITMGVYDKAFV